MQSPHHPLWAQCGELAEALAEDMARESLRGRTLTLKLKTSAFEARAMGFLQTRNRTANCAVPDALPGLGVLNLTKRCKKRLVPQTSCSGEMMCSPRVFDVAWLMAAWCRCARARRLWGATSARAQQSATGNACKADGSMPQVRTRAVTLGSHISAGADIRAEALRLLRMELPLELRLMGIRMSSFLQVPRPGVP